MDLQDVILLGELLECACLSAVRNDDVKTFERNFAQLKTYYDNRYSVTVNVHHLCFKHSFSFHVRILNEWQMYQSVNFVAKRSDPRQMNICCSDWTSWSCLRKTESPSFILNLNSSLSVGFIISRETHINGKKREKEKQKQKEIFYFLIMTAINISFTSWLINAAEFTFGC